MESKHLTCASIAVISLLLASGTTYAGSATWRSDEGTGDWHDSLNWNPETVPNGPSDIATFGPSEGTAVTVNDVTTVNGITYTSDASEYTTTLFEELEVSGAGIDNGATTSQHFTMDIFYDGSFVHSGSLLFRNSATTGSSATFLLKGNSPTKIGASGLINFWDNSTVGPDNTFILEGGSYLNSGNAGFPASIYFKDNASAGDAQFTAYGRLNSGGAGGYIQFDENATVANAGFVINGGSVADAPGATVDILDGATPANGIFLINGAGATGATGGTLNISITGNAPVNARITINGGLVSGAAGGLGIYTPALDAVGSYTITVNGGSAPEFLGGEMRLQHHDWGSGTLTANGGNGANATGGLLFFEDTPGGHSNIIASGGTNGGLGGMIQVFSANTFGATSRVKLSGNGTLDIHSSAQVFVGSLEGTGIVILAMNALHIGNNNRSTVFSGAITSDPGVGTVFKEGTGKLGLRGASTYQGGTTVSAGTLSVDNTTGSGTGTGFVQANDGATLAGKGKISGTVTIGDGSGASAFLAPAGGAPGKLSIRQALTFKSNSTYQYDVTTTPLRADSVVAKGVVIQSGALFAFNQIGTGTLTPGIVLTAINNTSTNAISGQFSNLADGSIFTSGSNTYLVNYSGGTGNDLTLTVQ